MGAGVVSVSSGPLSPEIGSESGFQYGSPSVGCVA